MYRQTADQSDRLIEYILCLHLSSVVAGEFLAELDFSLAWARIRPCESVEVHFPERPQRRLC